MNEPVKGSGKTVDEALAQALATLALTKDEVTYTIVQEPDAGVFGIFGKKEAVVEVLPIDNPAKKAQTFLSDMLGAMGIDCVVSAKLNGDILNIDLSGENMGILIGRRGQTLDAIQYLTSLIVNKRSDQYIRVIIDTENYRQKRKKTLEMLAKKMARNVLRNHHKMN